MIMAFASRQIAVPLLDNDTQSTRRHFTGNRTNQALWRYNDWQAEFRKGITATLRTRLWLASGWGCQGRRLSRE